MKEVVEKDEAHIGRGDRMTTVGLRPRAMAPLSTVGLADECAPVRGQELAGAATGTGRWGGDEEGWVRARCVAEQKADVALTTLLTNQKSGKATQSTPPRDSRDSLDARAR